MAVLTHLTEEELSVLKKDALIRRCINLQADNALLKSTLETLQDKVNVLSTAVEEIRKQFNKNNNNQLTNQHQQKIPL